MTATTLHGKQLRNATVARAKIDAAFEATLAGIESNITSILNTMSTDAERMAAVEALTTAFQNADGTLQGMITSMVNSTRDGAGLNGDGSLTLPVGHNYLTGATSLKAAIGLLDAALKTEESARIAAVNTLQTNIQAIVNTGAAQTATDLANEIAARQAGDATNATAINTEKDARIAADADLQTQITNEVSARTALNTTLSGAIADEASARTAAVSAEATTRASADTVLQNGIDAEALARSNADTALNASLTAEITARTAADTNETNARVAADNALSARITTLENAVPNQLTYSKIFKRVTPTGAIDGVNKTFTLPHTPAAGTEEVFFNGSLWEPGAGNDYTISGNTITTIDTPSGDDKIRVNYMI